AVPGKALQAPADVQLRQVQQRAARQTLSHRPGPVQRPHEGGVHAHQTGARRTGRPFGGRRRPTMNLLKLLAELRALGSPWDTEPPSAESTLAALYRRRDEPQQESWFTPHAGLAAADADRSLQDIPLPDGEMLARVDYRRRRLILEHRRLPPGTLL